MTKIGVAMMHMTGSETISAMTEPMPMTKTAVAATTAYTTSVA